MPNSYFRPKKDPLAKSREEVKPDPAAPDIPAEDQVKAAVCQLADLPYDEQLKSKMVEIEKLMANLRKEFLLQVRKIVSFCGISQITRANVGGDCGIISPSQAPTPIGTSH